MVFLELAQGLLSTHKRSSVVNNKGLLVKVPGWVPNSTVTQSLQGNVNTGCCWKG